MDEKQKERLKARLKRLLAEMRREGCFTSFTDFGTGAEMIVIWQRADEPVDLRLTARGRLDWDEDGETAYL